VHVLLYSQTSIIFLHTQSYVFSSFYNKTLAGWVQPQAIEKKTKHEFLLRPTNEVQAQGPIPTGFDFSNTLTLTTFIIPLGQRG